MAKSQEKAVETVEAVEAVEAAVEVQVEEAWLGEDGFVKHPESAITKGQLAELPLTADGKHLPFAVFLALSQANEETRAQARRRYALYMSAWYLQNAIDVVATAEAMSPEDKAYNAAINSFVKVLMLKGLDKATATEKAKVMVEAMG